MKLIRQDQKFIWLDYDRAFVKLKSKLVNAPILAAAQQDEPFILTTDASKDSIGGVFAQVLPDGTQGMVRYNGRELNTTECRYSVTDKDVLSCRNFGHYIWVKI